MPTAPLSVGKQEGKIISGHLRAVMRYCTIARGQAGRKIISGHLRAVMRYCPLPEGKRGKREVILQWPERPISHSPGREAWVMQTKCRGLKGRHKLNVKCFENKPQAVRPHANKG